MFFLFLFSITILGNSISHFLQMIIHISLVGLLTQIRMVVDSVTFRRMRSRRGQYIYFLCQHPEIWIHFLLKIIIWCNSASHFFHMVILIS